MNHQYLKESLWIGQIQHCHLIFWCLSLKPPLSFHDLSALIYKNIGFPLLFLSSMCESQQKSVRSHRFLLFSIVLIIFRHLNLQTVRISFCPPFSVCVFSSFLGFRCYFFAFYKRQNRFEQPPKGRHFTFSDDLKIYQAIAPLTFVYTGSSTWCIWFSAEVA